MSFPVVASSRSNRSGSLRAEVHWTFELMCSSGGRSRSVDKNIVTRAAHLKSTQLSNGHTHTRTPLVERTRTATCIGVIKESAQTRNRWAPQPLALSRSLYSIAPRSHFFFRPAVSLIDPGTSTHQQGLTDLFTPR